MSAYSKKILGVIMFINLILFIYLSCISLINKQDYHKHINKMNITYEQSSNAVVPNENFIFLKKYLFKNEKDINCNPKDDENCKIEALYTTASGIAINNDGNELKILTAAHWCFETFIEDLSNLDIDEEGNPIVANYYYQADFFGHSYELKILNIDLRTDLCLASIKSPYANQAKKINIAKNIPKIGEKVYSISAPQGVSSHFTRLHFEGAFAGCDHNMVDMPFCFYSLPASPGSSGSGVLNSNGELIGIISISIQGFDNISAGPNPYVIEEFLK